MTLADDLRKLLHTETDIAEVDELVAKVIHAVAPYVLAAKREFPEDAFTTQERLNLAHAFGDFGRNQGMIVRSTTPGSKPSEMARDRIAHLERAAAKLGIVPT